jgi:hypothetical protein
VADDIMNLRSVVEESADAGFLHEMNGFTAVAWLLRKRT